MTARLACSAGDPTHHLPPGSASSKTIEYLLCPSKQWAVWIGSRPKIQVY